MSNFFKSNEQQSMTYAYYPQPIELDEETGKISAQSFEESIKSAKNNDSQPHENSQPQSIASQQQASGMNMEKIMSMLKGGSNNDMLSAFLANGMKNTSQQNPMMAQAFSKLLNPTKKSDKTVTHSTKSSTTFEEM